MTPPRSAKAKLPPVDVSKLAANQSFLGSKSQLKDGHDLPFSAAVDGLLVIPPPLPTKPQVAVEATPPISDENRMEINYWEEIAKLPYPLDVLKRGIRKIGSGPDNASIMYQKLSLPYSSLKSIDPIARYPNLFTLELQGNQISDLKPLAQLKYLVHLDVSSNLLTECLGPDYKIFNLQYLDMSRNQIEHLTDLSSHRFLTNLSLDHVTGLSGCQQLKVLSLNGNQIESIEPLRTLPLKHLEICNNKIVSLDVVRDLRSLQILKARGNLITDLSPFANHALIGYVDVTENKIESLQSIGVLNTAKNLRTLKIEANPFTKNSESIWNPERDFPYHPTAAYAPSWRLYIVFMVRRLTVLNDVPVIPEEKVAADNAYNPSTEVSISTQHMNRQRLNARIYSTIRCEDLLRAQRLRPIVLCGPNGSGKRTLANRLLKEYPHIYGLSVSHTSREPRPDEDHGVHYWFSNKKEMEQMNSQGQFLQVVKLFGNMYGTAKESIDRVTEQGKVCVMALEYEGVKALKKAGLNARYILITIPNLSVLEDRLTLRFGNTPTANSNIEQWIEKAKGFNEDNELTFDYEILNDNLEMAYKKLKEYCLTAFYEDFEKDE